MKLEEAQYSDVVIIGNGFDLNLDLKTSYIDFIDSDYFQSLLGKNQLASHLKSKHNLKNWIDIEIELFNYSRELISGAEILNFEFKSLRDALIQYLKSIEISNINKNTHSYDLIEKIKDKDFLILNFNYTGATKLILKSVGLNDQEINSRLIHVHGSIEKSDIIFGIHDKARIKPQHIFLRKGYPTYYKGINVQYLLQNSKRLYVFGHSLGITDHSYFESYFSVNSSKQDIEKFKTLNLYYHGEQSYSDLHEELEILTVNNLSLFKQLNVFNSIDTSK